LEHMEREKEDLTQRRDFGVLKSQQDRFNIRAVCQTKLIEAGLYTG